MNLSKKDPTISVVMACYREPVNWLRDCIDSVLTQSFSDFEFIIVVDDPENIELILELENYANQDLRIKLLINERNSGLAVSLNRAIDSSTAPLLARMDADDICDNNRLKIQLEFLAKHPNVSLVGSAIQLINEKNCIFGSKSYYRDDKLIRKIIPYSSVTCHPTWMLKRELYNEVGGYRDLSTAQDYDFLYRVLDLNKQISNIEKPLLNYRVHQQSITGGLSLNRYKIRRYIHKMHKDRLQLGHDSFNKKTLNDYLSDAEENSKVINLLSQLRQTKKSNVVKKLYYLVQLFIYSNDIRERVFDHIRLKIILATDKMSNL